MQTALYSLSKIFSENIFRIPDYQRGYSWRERHTKDFWNDIELLEQGSDHYTGVLTLEEAAIEKASSWEDAAWIIENKKFSPYYVVDGQQRLTTALVLIQCVIERIGDDGELNFTTIAEIKKKFIFECKPGDRSRTYLFGYETDNPSREFLKTQIFLDDSEMYSPGEDTIYTQNLQSAKDFFSQKLQALTSDQVADVYKKLTQNFLFNIYTMSADINVFVAFETMNNRGKPLSDLELLKNRLIYLSTRLATTFREKEKVRTVVNEAWKSVYHYLGRSRNNPLDDDAFLVNHFLVYFGQLFSLAADPYIQHDLPRRLLLDRIFTTKNMGQQGAATPPEDKSELKLHMSAPRNTKPGQYKPPPATLDMIREYAADLKATVEHYYRLHNPGDSKFHDVDKITLTRLNRLGWHDAMPLVLVASRLRTAKNSKDVSRLLRAMEMIIFRWFLLHKARVVHEFSFLKYAIELQSDQNKISDIARQLSELSGQTLNVEEKIVPTGPLMVGYYGWHGLAYLFFEYEMSLKPKNHVNRDKIDWKTFVSEDYGHEYSTIEHIYPANPTSADWPEFADLTTRQRQQIRNSLGNLVALSSPKNKSLGNRCFLDKCAGSEDHPGYRTGSYSEIEVASNTNWSPSTIAHRGVKILEFIERRWNVKFGDSSAKLRALGIQFLEGKVSLLPPGKVAT